METKRVIEILKNVPLFAKLDKQNLEVLSRIIVERKFDKGSVIVSQGESGIGFYIIESGKVEVYREKDGEKFKLNEISGGEFFGEMALFDELPRTATVVALEPTNCYIITNWHFRGVIDSNPSVAAQMLEVIAKRFSQLNEQI